VRAHDPVALDNARSQFPNLGISYSNDLNFILDDTDAIILITEWPIYRELDWEAIPPVPVIDGRNFLDHAHLAELGFRVVGIGK